MSSEENYDLKKSGKKFRLYPVLTDKKGNIIDGNNRREADQNWKTEIVEGVETEEDLLTARLVANTNRRIVSPEEKSELINRLAEIYRKQGYKSVITGNGNEIVKKLKEVTGWTQEWVNSFLDEKYKAYTVKNRKRKPAILEPERVKKLLLQPDTESSEQKNKTKSTSKTFDDYIQKCKEIQKVQPLTKNITSQFVGNGDNLIESVIKPLQRFNRIEIDVQELDTEQRKEILTTLLETEKRIAEWKEALG